MRGNPLLGLYREMGDSEEKKTAALLLLVVEKGATANYERRAVGTSVGQGGRQDVSAGRQLRSIRACRRRGAAVVIAYAWG